MTLRVTFHEFCRQVPGENLNTVKRREKHYTLGLDHNYMNNE